MGIRSSFEDILSNPNFVNESREMKEIIDKVWDSQELSDKDYDFFNFQITKNEGQQLFRAHLNNMRKE